MFLLFRERGVLHEEHRQHCGVEPQAVRYPFSVQPLEFGNIICCTLTFCPSVSHKVATGTTYTVLQL